MDSLPNQMPPPAVMSVYSTLLFCVGKRSMLTVYSINTLHIGEYSSSSFIILSAEKQQAEEEAGSIIYHQLFLSIL